MKNALADTLGRIIATHVKSVLSGERDCRLIFPGLTNSFAIALHQQVRHEFNSKGIDVPAYLALDDPSPDLHPSHSEGRLLFEALTSIRHGSFVVVCMPKVLPKLQDSMRGSGSPIRAETFSDEWPWQDDGVDEFRFDGPVLDALLQAWCPDENQRKQLRDVTIRGLLRATRHLSGDTRSRLVIEEMVGSFSPQLHPDIDDVVGRYCFHCGIPRITSNDGSEALSYIEKVVRCTRSFDTMRQQDPRFRDHLTQEVLPNTFASHNDLLGLEDAVQRMLDGALELGPDSGLLGFHGGIGRNSSSESTQNWVLLDEETLCKLFGVGNETDVVRCRILPHPAGRGVVSKDGKAAAVFDGDGVTIEIEVEAREGDFLPGNAEIRCKAGLKLVWQQQCSKPQEKLAETITADYLPDNGKRTTLTVDLLRSSKVVANAKLFVHVCGDNRPGLTVLEPGFQVADLVDMGPDEEGDQLDSLAVETPEPVALHILDWAGEKDCEVYVQDSPRDVEPVGNLPGDQTEGRTYKLTEVVDAEQFPGGQAELRVRVSSLERLITLEGKDISVGEFTLEDELRVATATSAKSRLERALPLFCSGEDLALPRLGDIDAASRKRMELARYFEGPAGWKPVALDFLASSVQQTHEGDYWRAPAGGLQFLMHEVPSDTALNAVRGYEESRGKLMRDAELRRKTYATPTDRPLYVVVSNYVANDEGATEQSVCEYLSAYSQVLELLCSPNLGNADIFLLSHLDSVVLDNSGQESTAIDLKCALLGPWHPLVIAKRFLTQKSIYEIATSKVASEKKHRGLVSLFDRLDGFRVVPGSDIDSPGLVETFFAFPTSDPGWHFALSSGGLMSLSGAGPHGIQDIGNTLRRRLGLTSSLCLSDAEVWSESFLRGYHQAHPSKRQLGIRVGNGVHAKQIVDSCARMLHDTEGRATRFGDLLPGGVHLFLSGRLEDRRPLNWRRPMVHVYEQIQDEKCYAEFAPDILLLPRSSNPKPTRVELGREEDVAIPRGCLHGAAFYMPLVKLSSSKQGTRNAQLIESNAGAQTNGTMGENSAQDSESTGRWFSKVLHQIDCAVGRTRSARLALTQELAVPPTLKCEWTVLPGSQVDAGSLAHFVADGQDSAGEDRALWDYRLDLGRSINSYFIISKVPTAVRIALRRSALMLTEEAVSEALREIAEVGVAVGETMRSGKAAVGVLGVVGALRLIRSAWPNTTTRDTGSSAGTCTVVIPVDCFVDVLAPKKGSGAQRQRSDLLAIRLAWSKTPTSRLAISACSVESKFVSSKFSDDHLVSSALDQAEATSAIFEELVSLAQSKTGMHARLALVRLIQFGMRLLSARDAVSLPDEQAVLDLLLSGAFELVSPKERNLLVSTSCGSMGETGLFFPSGGCWVNFTKSSWPVQRASRTDPVIGKIQDNFSSADEFAKAGDGAETISATAQTPVANPNQEAPGHKPRCGTAELPPGPVEHPNGVDDEENRAADDEGLSGPGTPSLRRGTPGRSAGVVGGVHPVFEGFVGNLAATKTLSLNLIYAERRGIKRIESTGLSGPRSTGKTELSRRVSSALGVPSLSLSETSLRNVDQLAERMKACARESGKPMLPVAREGGHPVLQAPPMLVFIDEVHQLTVKVQDSLLTVLEHQDRVLRASTETIDASKVSFMIATTDWGKLREPLRSRVRRIDLKPYTQEEVARMLSIHIRVASEATDGSFDIDPAAARLGEDALRAIATAARAIPRTAISFLREIGMALETGDLGSPELDRVWEYLQQKVPCDRKGLTPQDRNYLRILSGRGSAGLDNLGAELGTDRSNVENEIEPFLMQSGWVRRTSTGRKLTPLGRELIMQLPGE